MAEIKTQRAGTSVSAFLDAIGDEARRQDCRTVDAIMKRVTGSEPRMWGTSIVGYGDHRYRLANGSENDWFLVGFSPRKANLTLYLGLGGFVESEPLLAKLGRHKTGKGCLYLDSLDQVHAPTLEKLIAGSVKRMLKAPPVATRSKPKARATRGAASRRASTKRA